VFPFYAETNKTQLSLVKSCKL